MAPSWFSARLLCLVFAAYPVVGGMLSFAGWAFGIPRWIDWWGTGITIKANAAVCLVMLGSAIVLRQLAPVLRIPALALAAGAGVIGLATLLQHVFAIDLGIDTLLFDEPPGSPATAAPGRMGPPASISFVLLAIACAMAAHGSRTVLAIALPLLVLVMAMLSLIGYLYGAEVMYTVPRLTGIAGQTVTMIASLACALVAAQPQRQPVKVLMEDTTAGDLARRLIPLAIALPILLGWGRVAGQRAGFFDLAFGSAVRTIVEIIFLSGVVWWTVHVVRARDQQRRDAAEARFVGERRLRRVVDASALPFMVLAPVTDQQGAIVDFRWNYVNRSAAAVFGREGASLTGAHISQLHPEMWQEPGLFEHLTAVALRQDVHNFEVRSIAGVQGWFQVIASSLDQEIGVWFHDVGERKRHEAELRAADQRKDEFLATLAHELRNPLAPIRMAAALAKKPNVAADQQRWCHDVIDRQARHMSLLLDDLLDVSRITRGTLVVRRVPTLLASLVDSALETSRPLIESKQHALSVDFPRDTMVDVDPLRLAQIVSNLLNNAAKYTPAGGSIGLSIALDQGDLTIRVRDTGIGLERSELDGIFNMFSQVERAQDRAEGGLGIGLALARGLVELHGGTISVRSEGTGRGSVFTVRIPRALVDAPVPSAVSGAARSAPSPLRILIADDNVDAAQSLAMLLSCDGHECLLAAEGDTALGVFHESSPDVILLDIGMPRMSGLEVARRIRAVDAGVLLIAITGWGQTCDRQRSAEAGFDHHLTKPVDHEALALLLDSRTGGADGTRTRSRDLSPQ